jgi:hypothetical protein
VKQCSSVLGFIIDEAVAVAGHVEVCNHFHGAIIQMKKTKAFSHGSVSEN